MLSAAGLHISYYEGTLELMTISPLHERIKTIIARLVELFTLERDIQLEG